MAVEPGKKPPALKARNNTSPASASARAIDVAEPPDRRQGHESEAIATSTTLAAPRTPAAAPPTVAPSHAARAAAARVGTVAVRMRALVSDPDGACPAVPPCPLGSDISYAQRASRG